MPRPSTTRAPGLTYRLVLQREDSGETVAQYGKLTDRHIGPILQGLASLVQLAGFKRDLVGLLQRLGL